MANYIYGESIRLKKMKDKKPCKICGELTRWRCTDHIHPGRVCTNCWPAYKEKYDGPVDNHYTDGDFYAGVAPFSVIR